MLVESTTTTAAVIQRIDEIMAEYYAKTGLPKPEGASSKAWYHKQRLMDRMPLERGER